MQILSLYSSRPLTPSISLPCYSLALALAVLIGLACTGLLLALRQPIFRLMSLEHEVRRRAHTLFAIRASATPFVFVGRACLGLLGGYQRVMLVAGLSAASAALDIAGNYIALHVLHWGLDGTGWATALAQAALAVASLVCAVALPPAEARGRVRWCSRNPNPHPAPPNPAVVAVTTEPSLSVINETAPLLSTAQPPRPRPLSAVRDYLRASGHIVVRAVLLQTATYSLAVVAARLGTAVLAAHQIVAQLWMVTSYINDGFADVGTMVGGRFWGAGRLEPLRQLARRLLLLGLSVGLVALTVLLAARHPLQRLFTHDVVTLQVVDGVWLLLALMQPVNAAVFVYDGLLYAMQAFAFKRNIVALATLGLYLPAIAWAALYFHNLLAVWVAYALLTACRCAGAGWKHRSLEAAHRAQRS